MGEKKAATKKKAVPRRSYNKRRKIDSTFLPDDIIFHILVRLPADFLLNTIRYVCKQWYNVISDPLFVKEQVLVHSNLTIGICFQCHSEQIVSFAQFGDKKGTISKLLTLPHYAHVISTCDGLILFKNERMLTVHVANPLTKQILTLPPINSISKTTSYSLARVRSTMEYKVVFTICNCQLGLVSYGVITLGKDDKWRIADNRFIGLCACDKVRSEQPLLAGNFLHWSVAFTDSIVSFDAESEKLYISRKPKSDKKNIYTTRYVVRGDSLTCIMCYSDTTPLLDVWVLLNNDGREWKFLCVIDFLPQKSRLRRMVKNTNIRPVAWIQNGEVVVFKACDRPDPFIAYNVKTGYFFQLRVHEDHVCQGFISSFSPSLVSLKL